MQSCAQPAALTVNDGAKGRNMHATRRHVVYRTALIYTIVLALQSGVLSRAGVDC